MRKYELLVKTIMTPAWFFIVSASLAAAMLFGRYRLRILLSRSPDAINASVTLRSLGSLFGLDWDWDGSVPCLRLVLFRKNLRLSGGLNDSRQKPEERDERGRAAGKAGKKRLPVRDLGKTAVKAWRMVIRIARPFRLERGRVAVLFGTGDPSSTGMLFGLTQTFHPLHGNRMKTEIVPDFLNRKLEGEADLTLRFTMARLIGALIAVLIHTAGLKRL